MLRYGVVGLSELTKRSRRHEEDNDTTVGKGRPAAKMQRKLKEITQGKS